MSSEPDPQAEDHSRPPRRNWQATTRPHWIEIDLAAGLIVVGIAQACIYMQQAAIMKRQASISDQQLALSQADERPFVWLDGLVPDQSYNSGPYNINFSFRNMGRSVALDVVADFSVEIGDITIPPLDLIKKFGQPCKTCSPDIMPVGVPFVRRHQIASEKMTPQTLVDLTHGSSKSAIWFIGRVDYKGIDGAAYSSGVCYRIQINPAQFVSCPFSLGLIYARQHAQQNSTEVSEEP